MMKFFICVIGIAAYFLLGWVAKDIIWGMIDVTPEMTFGDIQTYEYAIYSVVSVVILIIIWMIRVGCDDDSASVLAPITLVICIGLVVNQLPLVLGTVILYNLTNIGAIIWGSFNRGKN